LCGGIEAGRKLAEGVGGDRKVVKGTKATEARRLALGSDASILARRL